MKNYPNQAASLQRVRSTLSTIAALNVGGRDSTDDGVLGYELARLGYYTFRGLHPATTTPTQLANRIAAERRKPASSQGSRTNAREMRRTLRTMGWVHDHSGGVTSAGQAVLRSAPGSLEERALLAEGLLRVAVTDDAGNTSHPIRVMLRLLEHRPSQHREGLELALEALDDTDAEFRRVRQLYNLSASSRQDALGISDHQRNNARKIFPSLARTAGLVAEKDDGYFHLTTDGRAVLGLPQAQVRTEIAARARRRALTGRLVTAATVAQRGASGNPSEARTPEQQAQAGALLAERTDRHQNLVRGVARLIQTDGEMYEDPFSYDLLWVPADATLPIILFEMKTISGDPESQTRLAVGQLSYYHFFEVSPNWPDRGVVEVAAFDATLPGGLVEYLTSEDIAAIWLVTSDNPAALNQLGLPVLAALRL